MIGLGLSIVQIAVRQSLRDLFAHNLETEDGFNLLIEDGFFLLLEG
jgi:hypothetical protein